MSQSSRFQFFPSTLIDNLPTKAAEKGIFICKATEAANVRVHCGGWDISWHVNSFASVWLGWKYYQSMVFAFKPASTAATTTGRQATTYIELKVGNRYK